METKIIKEKTMASFLDPEVNKTLKLCQRGTNYYVMNEEGHMAHIPNVHTEEMAIEAFKIYRPL